MGKKGQRANQIGKSGIGNKMQNLVEMKRGSWGKNFGYYSYAIVVCLLE